jgi:hypothetical protein
MLDRARRSESRFESDAGADKHLRMTVSCKWPASQVPRLIVSALNSAMWLSAIALVCAAAGISIEASDLAGVGLLILLLSDVGLTILMANRR